MEIDKEMNEALEKIFMPYAHNRQRQLAATGERLVHYTTADGTVKILRSKSLWLRNALVMHDFSEIQHGHNRLLHCLGADRRGERFANALNACAPNIAGEVARLFDSFWYQTRTQTYIACLSEHDAAEDTHGRLSMWRAFGQQSIGIALVFKVPPAGVGCAGVRNQGQMQFLATIASLVRPRFGYLRQRPELQRTLPAQYQDEQWEELCDRQFELVEQLVSAYHGEIGVSRNSFDPIRNVIDLPQPMDAVADMVQRMRADRPVGRHPRYEAVWARNLVLIKLLASNALRRRNLAHLTWRADNTGHLYQKEDRSWWIHIPRQQFKNTCGAAGDFDYDSPVHPSAWADIEKYLFVHRKMMMRGPTDLVFLTLEDRRSAGKNRPWLEMSATVSALTNRYLLRSPGIGPHAFRHIVATSILKADGGDHKTAAKVLNDRVSTVEKHYAGLRSADGAVRMAELLDGPFSRM